VAPESENNLRLEIGHVLFIDLVGYSKLLIEEQRERLGQLTEIVSATGQVCEAPNEQLVRLPTGDGMALVFRNSVEEPAQCALEIALALKAHQEIAVRMGIHSGPVSDVIDVNGRSNIAGAGINLAQRVMDCGDAGHILLSQRVADDLAQYRQWSPRLHDLGECEVKHGVRLHVVNLYTEELGNPAVPEKFKKRRKSKPRLPVSSRRATPPKSRWPLALVSVVLAVGLVAGFLFFWHRPPAASTGMTTKVASPTPMARREIPTVPEKSIAVLPFENLSENKENGFFADGVQDEILTNLARVADLKVISRTSVISYRDTAGRNLRKIGQELGVAHLVEGSVQRSGSRVRVNAQLVDARTDTHQWAQTYDRDLADVFAIQSEIAKAIADQLQAKLSPRERAEIERAPTANLAAFDLYTQAMQLSERGSFSTPGIENTRQAEALLKQALALDPNFFLAYCRLQYVSDNFYFFNIDRTPARKAVGEAAVQAAIRLNPNAGETHLAIADHLYRINADYDGARAELEKAKQALPNSSRVYEWTGYIDRRQGRWEDSLRNHQRSLELDPRNHFLYQQIALTYEHLRRYREMAAALDKTLELSPGDIETRVARAVVDFDERADTDPLYRTIHDILATTPGSETTVAEQWIWLSQARRDVAEGERAAAALSETGLTRNGLVFPRPFCQAVFAQLKDDRSAMQDELLKARKETEAKLQAAPDYGPTLVILGLIDAALGRKEDAIREGKRAIELMPITRKSIEGAQVITYLAVIYAWTGEKDLAIERLEESARIPAGVSYGDLKLLSYFDSLRGDPRFEKIVASLAPKEAKY